MLRFYLPVYSEAAAVKLDQCFFLCVNLADTQLRFVIAAVIAKVFQQLERTLDFKGLETFRLTFFAKY